MGELIAVLSGKGGTGKTSVCAGLATALAQAGQKVLCIDCDIGLRNLDISLGISQFGALSFSEVTAFDGEQALAHPKFPSLRFLTAPIGCLAEQVDTAHFFSLLQEARPQFDFIFLDAPAGIDAGFRLAARGADRILLVTGADPAAIRDAERAGTELELMGKQQVRLIVNRIQPKMVQAMGLTVDDIMDRTGLPLLGVVPEDPRVMLSAAAGTPLLTLTRRGAVAACRRIAQRLLGHSVPIPL